MGANVFNDDALSGKDCRAAGTGTDADLDSLDRVIVESGQTGCSAGIKVPAINADQHDAAKHVRLLLLHAAHDRFQYGDERCAMGEQFQHMIAGMFPLLGLCAVGGVADKPAPDKYDVEGGGQDAAGKQQVEH